MNKVRMYPFIENKKEMTRIIECDIKNKLTVVGSDLIFDEKGFGP